MMNVTRDDVLSAANVLIAQNGKTTTLEVKNHLRANLFWAKQSTIREYMLDITSQNSDIAYRETGFGYREYYKSSSQPVNTPTPVGTAYNWGGYQVWDGVDNNTMSVYYNVSRGQAKNLWANEFGRDFFEARTKKLT